jgi:hypothetical protein
MNRKAFTFVLGAVLLVSLPVFAASPYHYALDRTNFSLIPGIEYTFDISVLDQSNRLATNYFGRLIGSTPSPGITFGPYSLDVIRGRILGPISLMLAGGEMVMVISDEQGVLNPLTNVVTTVDPEQKWSPSPPSLVINEIMYDTDIFLEEWIEFRNPTTSSVIFTNYTVYISDSLNPSGGTLKNKIKTTARTVPPNTYSVLSGGFMVFARDLSRFQLHYPDVYDAVLSQADGFAGSVIVEIEQTSPSYDLDTTIETVYIRSNDSTNAPILSLVCYNGAWGGKDGYSLSRRDPLASALSPLNWSSSPDIGGTPCQENNSRITFPPAAGTLSLSTNIIDPDRSFLTITAEAREDLQTASVDIVSSTGRSVRSLGKTDNMASGDLMELVFDCRDENGNVLPLGLYFVRFTGIAPDGRRTVGMKTLVIAGGMR